MTYPNETHASEHFAWKEGNGGLDRLHLAGPIQRVMLAKLALVLEKIRAHFGKPVNVTNGYRSLFQQTALWNAAVKKYGSESAAAAWVAHPGNSQHEKATAADIWIAGVTPREIADYAATIPGVGGIGIYTDEGFAHIDIRPLGDDGVIDRWGK